MVRMDAPRGSRLISAAGIVQSLRRLTVTAAPEPALVAPALHAGQHG